VVEVPLIEDLAPHVRVQLPQAPYLAVLLGDEFLTHRRDLDEEVIVWQIEIRPKLPRGGSRFIPLDDKGSRFVLPRDRVEIEESREFPLAGVGELDLVGRPREEIVDQ
jgi:hypothetical protein